MYMYIIQQIRCQSNLQTIHPPVAIDFNAHLKFPTKNSIDCVALCKEYSKLVRS